MTQPTKVVFDCNTLLQALASPDGPAGACYQLAVDARVSLFVSSAVIEELRDVTARPKLVRKLRITPDRIEEFLESVSVVATLLDSFPEPFTYSRDPDDAHYVNLALAAGARLVVSRDKDLLDLMLGTTPEARQLLSDYPDFAVLTPNDLLVMMSSSR